MTNEDRVGASWLALLLAAAVVTLLVLAAGCGGSAPKHARTALDVVAVGLVEADRISHDQYDTHAAQALTQSTTAAEYVSRMAPMNRVELALREVHTALLVAQSGVSAWADGKAHDAKGALACVAEAVSELVDALDAAHVSVPSQIANGIALAPTFLGSCPRSTP